jgi:hypothetical protein
MEVPDIEAKAAKGDRFNIQRSVARQIGGQGKHHCSNQKPSHVSYADRTVSAYRFDIAAAADVVLMFALCFPQVFGFKISAATSQRGRAVTQTGAGQQVPRVTCQ